jgi:hypothetical protein
VDENKNRSRANLMNRLLVSVFVLSAVSLVFSDSRKSVLLAQGVMRIDSAKEIRAARSVAETYAESRILGTGADQYVASIHLVNATEIRVILGERDGDEDNKNAYTLNLRKAKKGWKIFSVEYIFIPTGKKQIDTLSTSFPYPHWRRDLKGTG